MAMSAVLVDGSSFVYRAYFGLPPLTDGENRPVGAVYGFCSALMTMLNKYASDLFCVALDSGRKTFRSDIYPEYKSSRHETPQDLKTQFPMIREACAAFGVPVVAKNGFEADDVIATYTEKLSSAGYEVRIMGSDKDLMQLVGEKITLCDPIKSKRIGPKEVQEKYGVLPSQMAYLQALMGDSADNIPGISGIGPKMAAELLREFGTLDGIYQNIDKIKRLKIRQSLIDQRDQLKIFLKLVTLVRDMEVEEDYRDFRISRNRDRLVDFMKSHNFDLLLRRLDSVA
ncbi:MAG: hypothetical protein LBB63_02355 [Holosporaceae bacterium]|jgi:DNA polymerase-1|nr:hypothetical protein [Holosporaceae bacterium]